MSDISSISGLGSLSNVLPTSNKNRMAGGRGNDGDNDGSKVSGGVGRANFMSAIEQALGQSLSRSAGAVTAAVTPNSASATNPAKDPQSALNPFLHNLFAGTRPRVQATGHRQLIILLIWVTLLYQGLVIIIMVALT